jgi:glycosyltransferase involved in cell wall biosynthesis
MKTPITVVILTKNEEHNIRNCLESVKFAAEIIIVDSGSADNTLQISKEYTDNIIVNTNWQGFGYQRKLALPKATNDWILFLDADETVSEQLAAEIGKAINSDKYQGYLIPFQSYFCGRKKLIKYGLWHHEKHLRLFNRRHAICSDDILHESVAVNGKLGKLTGVIFHQSYVNLEEIIEKMNRYSTDGAKMRLQKGKTSGLGKALWKGFWTFFRSYFLYAGFLDGKEGLILAISSAETTYYTYLKLGYLN